MAINYTSVDAMFAILPTLKTGVSNLTSGDMARFIEDAENEIDARLAKFYTVPVAGCPMLETIATDIAIYRVLSRRIFTATSLKESPWPDRYKEAVDLLGEIAEGKATLVDSSGSIIAAITTEAEVWSDKQDYLPTFHEGHDTEHIVDPDKLQDIRDDRDLSNLRDITD